MTMMLVIAVVTASAQTKRLRLNESRAMHASALPSVSRLDRRSRQLFDFGWQFTHNGKTVSVDLPHDWDIFEGPNSGKGATGTGGGWFEAGKGEYRKTFKTPIGEVVKFHFEGVYQKAEVYVNGQRAGQHHYGYTPFTVDVTPYINKDKKQVNEVVVKVDNSEQPNCRWYSGSGIYRHVWLETMPAMHIAENGVFVTTPEVSSDKARVQVDVTVQNESQTDRNATVVVGSAQLMVAVKAGESKTVTTTLFVNNEHTQRVASIEKGTGRGIMTGTDEVEACLLHLAHLTDLSIVEGTGPQHTVVVMYTGTIDKHFFAIEHEAILGIERERADAVFCSCVVDDVACLLQFYFRLIKRRTLGRP